MSPASASLSAGQSVTFTPTVTGTFNTNLAWSVNPQIGTLNNGVYKAPATITTTQIVTIRITSVVNSSATWTSKVTLVRGGTAPAPVVGVTVGPPSASLGAGKSMTFTASVSGTSNTAVTWSMSPAVGTLVKGVYTAPATIATAQTVTIKAASMASPSANGTAMVSLTPPPPVVGVTVGPSTIAVGAGQSTTFTASVTGTSNTAVTWSMSPAVGTLVNGVYTAPATITSAQTITIKATSVASPSVSGTGSVTLTPPPVVVGITVGPSLVAVAAGKSTTFIASVTGTTNTAVTWSYSPVVGTLVNGVYTAPLTIASAQMITVTATSQADSTKSASATVSLTPASSGSAATGTPTTTTITLPVEVMGPDGTTASVSFSLPESSSLSGASLWLKIHGLKYDSEASVQVNNSAWLPLSTGNVTLLGNAAAFGGIGGGFRTLQMNVNVPPGALVAGTNTITFRFNATNGVTSGFRVLGFNVAVGGNNLLPASLFVLDDPSTWQPPSTSTSDITAGETLWRGASLTVPGVGAIQARCADCHAQDGRDLKYFNYSNNSIEARAAFHGLTAQQGAQIASYIRSLNQPSPGRPWNPPYQPGPGLDSQPVANWAAGAGIDAVLDNDADMQPYLAPGGSTAGWSATSYLNAREIPVVMQFPDWNSWLPTIHPKDSLGATFTNSKFNALYSTVRQGLQANPAGNYWGVAINAMTQWFEALGSLVGPVQQQATSNNWASPNIRSDVYSMAQLQMVKMWEINQEFGLEGMPQAVFGAKADSRGWYGNTAFNTSPNILHIPAGDGIGNGSPIVLRYLTLVWYQVQLVLNDGQGTQSGHTPIDYGYVGGYIKDIFSVYTNLPGGMLQLEFLIKCLQEYTQTGVSPAAPAQTGWHVIDTSPMELVNLASFPVWSTYSPSTVASLFTAYTQQWFNQASQYTPTQYYTGGWVTPSEDPAKDAYSATFGGQMWYMLPRLRLVGVPASLTDQIASWGATIWPRGNWALNDLGVCISLQTCTTGF
jgi:hypothetical protein